MHMNRYLTLIVCMGIFSVIFEASPRAQDAEPIDKAAITQSLSDSVQLKIGLMETFVNRSNDNFARHIEDLKNHFNSQYTRKIDKQRKAMPFYEMINGLTAERVFSSFTAREVETQIENIRREAFAGKLTVQNSDSTSDVNPMSATTTIAMDAIIAKKLDTIFCIPGSKLATEECAGGQIGAGAENNNFVDMFLGTGTWPGQTILDSLLLTRRFFSSAFSRVDINQSAANPATFMTNQRRITRDNIRLAIFDDLASRRAPTSNATYHALQMLLFMLAPSNQITSQDYRRICANPDANPIEKYICTLTGEPMGGDAGGQRAISQAALDKIMQYDLMLSNNFYSEIQSPAYQASGSIEKMEVFLKAQQVTQDYRQLRLLQMKVATTAMNIMN